MISDEMVYLARAELLGGCSPENVRRALEAALTPDAAVAGVVENWRRERERIETTTYTSTDVMRSVRAECDTTFAFEAADLITRLAAERDEARAAHEATINVLASTEAERDKAKEQVKALLVSYVNEHCDPIPEWMPLDDLCGLILQLDNAITVTREFKARATAAEAELAETKSLLAEARTEIAQMMHQGPEAERDRLKDLLLKYAGEFCEVRAALGEKADV